jgi:hypothetical protein
MKYLEEQGKEIVISNIGGNFMQWMADVDV